MSEKMEMQRQTNTKTNEESALVSHMDKNSILKSSVSAQEVVSSFTVES